MEPSGAKRFLQCCLWGVFFSFFFLCGFLVTILLHPGWVATAQRNGGTAPLPFSQALPLVSSILSIVGQIFAWIFFLLREQRETKRLELDIQLKQIELEMVKSRNKKLKKSRIGTD